MTTAIVIRRDIGLSAGPVKDLTYFVKLFRLGCKNGNLVDNFGRHFELLATLA